MMSWFVRKNHIFFGSEPIFVNTLAGSKLSSGTRTGMKPCRPESPVCVPDGQRWWFGTLVILKEGMKPELGKGRSRQSIQSWKMRWHKYWLKAPTPTVLSDDRGLTVEMRSLTCQTSTRFLPWHQHCSCFWKDSADPLLKGRIKSSEKKQPQQTAPWTVHITVDVV